MPRDKAAKAAYDSRVGGHDTMITVCKDLAARWNGITQ